MFSGVAGMKAHQSKMDVIGNNIANVNTYGYKSQRAVFSDVYYQTLRGASAGNANRGGTNPSSVGYGSTLSAVQAQMTQSSLQNTGFGLDVAITGEGFFQVMDPDGNIFYTKAGLLDYDANGYLTDINGNFVLGAASKDGDPNSQKIKLDDLGSVSAKASSLTQEINNIKYTLTTSNADKAGNVSLGFNASEDIPEGLDAVAEISATSGAITVTFNANAKFSSMSEVNAAINKAITEANGGKQHEAGIFTLTANENVFGTDAASGGFTGSMFAKKPAFAAGTGFFDGAFVVDGFNFSSTPTAEVKPEFEISYNPGDSKYTIKTTVDGVEYSTAFAAAGLGNGSVVTLNTPAGVTPAGNIKLKVSNLSSLTAVLAGTTGSSVVPGAPVTSDGDLSVANASFFDGGFTLNSANPTIAAGSSRLTLTYDSATSAYTVTTTIGTDTYTGTFDDAIAAASGQVTLTSGTKNMTFDINSANIQSSLNTAKGQAAVPGQPAKSDDIQYTAPSYFLGGMTVQGVSTNFSGSGEASFAVSGWDAAAGTYILTATVGSKTYKGTVNLNGGQVRLEQDPKPTDPALVDFITVNAPNKSAICSNMGLPANSSNADIWSAISGSAGNENVKLISATPGKQEPLTGAQLAGSNFGIYPGKITGLENGAFGGGMVVKKTSSNFSASGKVDGFDAVFHDDAASTPPNPYWTVTMEIGGKTYTADISKDSKSSSILLKGDNDEHIEVSNPGFEALSTEYVKQKNDPAITVPIDGDSVSAFTDNTLSNSVVTAATPSKDLGLSEGFVLVGGTSGGTITLDQLSSISIGADGTVSVTHADKGTVVAGRISLANFSNPSGLQLSGNNYYTATVNSGDPVLCDPGSSGSGGLKSSALEMSNVDLSGEFADMITTQRGFQANSRIITVSDTMLEELINLKR